MMEKIYVFTSIVLSLFIGFEVFIESYLQPEPVGFESNVKYVIVGFAVCMTAIMLLHIYLTTYFVFTYIRMPKFNNKISRNVFYITGFSIVIEVVAFFINSWNHGFYKYDHYVRSNEWDDLILLVVSTSILGIILYLEFNKPKKDNV